MSLTVHSRELFLPFCIQLHVQAGVLTDDVLRDVWRQFAAQLVFQLVDQFIDDGVKSQWDAAPRRQLLYRLTGSDIEAVNRT